MLSEFSVNFMPLICTMDFSPYWLQSYSYTYSKFQNMGLWEFCFDGFRYPKYQYDHKFMGCNYIFTEEYRIIWQWMLPGKSSFNVFISFTWTIIGHLFGFKGVPSVNPKLDVKVMKGNRFFYEASFKSCLETELSDSSFFSLKLLFDV